MKKRKKYQIARGRDNLRHLEVESVASAAECTGLVPAGSPSGEEMENYRDIYDLKPEKKK